MSARNGWVGIVLLALAAAVAAASALITPMEVTLPPWAIAAAPLGCIAAVAAMAAREPIARLLRATLIALGLYGLAAGLHGLVAGIAPGRAPAAALDGFTSPASMVVGFLVACGVVAILAGRLFPRPPAARRRAAAATRLAAAAPRVDAPRSASAVPASPRAATSPALAAAAAGVAPGASLARPAVKRDARPVPRVTRAPEETEASRPVRRPGVLSVDNAAAVNRPPVARTAEPAASPGVLVRLPPPPAPGGGWKVGSAEPIVRISFDRVADQLPPDACRVSLDEVAAGLPEPGVLLVPQRLLIPQLPEGVIQVAWEDLVDQMPRAAFAVPPLALRDRVSNGRFLLPVDEVVLQMPREVFALTAPVMDVSGIREFSSPFGFGLAGAGGRALAGAPAGAVPQSLTPPGPVGAAASAPGAPTSEDGVEAPVAAPRPAPASWGEIVLNAGPKATAAAASPVPAAPALASETPTAATTTAASLRVQFGRIVPQLPAGAFRIPLDRVAANLLEPGHLLILRRLVEPQIAEGLIRVGWEDIAAQFPPRSLALTHEEMVAKLAGSRIALPLDEVIPQLPPEILAMPAPRPDLRGLDAIPDPFQVGPPAGPPPAVPMPLPAVPAPTPLAPVVGAAASQSAAVAPQSGPAADRSVLAEPMAPGRGRAPAAAARAELIEEAGSTPPVAATAAVPGEDPVAPGDLGAAPSTARAPGAVLGRMAAALASAGGDGV
ncbi:MAG TPA: hypothetical protein VMT79_02120 [Candidatus Binatia bacterium]|nr:hypothetical protein [Candidatus Binatia bacterium]